MFCQLQQNYGWIECESKKFPGTLYYFNVYSNISTWIRPIPRNVQIPHYNLKRMMIQRSPKEKEELLSLCQLSRSGNDISLPSKHGSKDLSFRATSSKKLKTSTTTMKLKKSITPEVKIYDMYGTVTFNYDESDINFLSGVKYKCLSDSTSTLSFSNSSSDCSCSSCISFNKQSVKQTVINVSEKNNCVNFNINEPNLSETS